MARDKHEDLKINYLWPNGLKNSEQIKGELHGIMIKLRGHSRAPALNLFSYKTNKDLKTRFLWYKPRNRLIDAHHVVVQFHCVIPCSLSACAPISRNAGFRYENSSIEN